MKKVIIINASGFGRECYWLVRGSIDYGAELTLKGFLDNRKDILNSYTYEHPILSSVEDYIVQEDDVFMCAISEPSSKRKYTSIIKEKGGQFINVIHPTATVSAQVLFGTGIIIGANCGISCNVRISDFVTINGFTHVGHDAYIKEYSHINSFCAINGGVELGEGSIVNSHGVILPKVKIGNNSVVGAGSVVLRNVPDNTTVFGVPAMPVKV